MSEPEQSSTKELYDGEKLFLIDFSAEWCGPCQAMILVLDHLKKRIGEKANVVTIDVDKYPQAATTFRIISLPTFVLFKKGEELWRRGGFITVREFEEVIQRCYATEDPETNREK